MIDQQLRELAQRMRKRREKGRPPYTLFLGSAAWLAPGEPTAVKTTLDRIDDIPDRFLAQVDDSESGRIEAFFSYLDAVDDQQRDDILIHLLKVTAPSAGHRHLANLVVNGYFRLLITTGLDASIEKAIIDAGLWSRDLVILCLSPQDAPLRRQESQAVHLVKLHGDPFAPDFWESWMEIRCSPQTQSLVAQGFDGETILVGYHPRDSLVLPLLEKGQAPLVYVTKDPDPAAYPPAIAHRRDLLITGEYGALDTFFGTLADLLLYRPVSVNIEQNVDTDYGSVVVIDSNIGGDRKVVAGGSQEIGPAGQEGEQPPDAEGERIKSLRSQLAALQENYYKLRKQAAMYGTGNAPTTLINQLKSIDAELQKLEAEINQLTNKEAGNEPPG